MIFNPRTLDAHLDMCLDIIASSAKFRIWHIPRHENQKANMLAQQESGYDVGGCNFHIQEQPMHENFNFTYADTEQSAQPTPSLP
jgi:hypothetical protein